MVPAVIIVVTTLRLCLLAVGSVLLAACGAGLPAEEPGQAAGTATGCETLGNPLDFVVDNTPTTIFWAANGRLNPNDPDVDQSLIKVLFEIPDNQLPANVDRARIRITPVRALALPVGRHVDTAFQISAMEPAGLNQFSGGSQNPLTLRIRYNPVACGITSAVESTLVLGRYNPDSATWNEVCGDLANTGASVREVSCANADLSFGIFAAIPRVTNEFNDFTAPTFPANSFNLSSPRRCNTCAPPTIDLEWGPATDGAGSGLLGYWIYVDGVQVVFTSDTTASPRVTYTLRSAGTLDTTREHVYQVQAVDNAGNRSALFGSLRL
jgi:hypothetical protein